MEFRPRQALHGCISAASVFAWVWDLRFTCLYIKTNDRTLQKSFCAKGLGTAGIALSVTALGPAGLLVIGGVAWARAFPAGDVGRHP
jgi:hypothetical protein